MPVYEYYCPAAKTAIEVEHSITESFETWGELCRRAGTDPGDTPADSPVEKLLFASGIATPKTNADLKNLGFTKLVKRDTGVYENVTATGGESRYMNAGDSSTLPDIKRKISD